MKALRECNTQIMMMIGKFNWYITDAVRWELHCSWTRIKVYSYTLGKMEWEFLTQVPGVESI